MTPAAAQPENPRVAIEAVRALIRTQIGALSTEAKALRQARKEQRSKTEEAKGPNPGRGASTVVIVRPSRARAAQLAVALRDLNAMLDIPDSLGDVSLGNQVGDGVRSTATTRDQSAGLGTPHTVTRAGPAEPSRPDDSPGNASRHLLAELPASTSGGSSPTLPDGSTTRGGAAVAGSHPNRAKPAASDATFQRSPSRPTTTDDGRAHYGQPHYLLRPFTHYNPSALTSGERELLRGLHRRILQSTDGGAHLSSDEAEALTTLTANREGGFSTGARVSRKQMETVLFGSVVKWLIKRTAEAHSDLAWTGLELDELRQDIAARSQDLFREWAEHPSARSLTTFVGNAIRWSAGKLGALYRNPVEYGGGATYHGVLYLAARIDTAIKALRVPGAPPSDDDIATWINQYGGLKRNIRPSEVALMRKRMDFAASLRASSEVDPRWRRYDEEEPFTDEAVPPEATDLLIDHAAQDPLLLLLDRQRAALLQQEIARNLTRRQAQAVTLLYGLGEGFSGKLDGFTPAEVAGVLGVSDSRVWQIERRALRRLWHHWHAWDRLGVFRELLPQ